MNIVPNVYDDDWNPSNAQTVNIEPERDDALIVLNKIYKVTLKSWHTVSGSDYEDMLLEIKKLCESMLSEDSLDSNYPKE